MKFSPNRFEYLIAGYEDGVPMVITGRLPFKIKSAADIDRARDLIAGAASQKEPAILIANFIYLRRLPLWERIVQP